MASRRPVNTNFWKDSYVVDLDPSEKLVFLYLLTNPRTNIGGIYEVTVREMAFDTGFDADMIRKILDRFERDGKLIFKDGWVALLNWQKHQLNNPSVHEGIKRVLAESPDWLKDLIHERKPGQRKLELGGD